MRLPVYFRNILLHPREFFFENLGVKQIIFKNTFWLVLAEAINKILRFIFIIYVVRILGATEYGKFTFALAFISLFGVFSDLGISQIFTREVAKEEVKKEELPKFFSLKLFLSLINLFLIFIGSFFITQSPDVQKIIWILAFLSALQGFSTIIFAFFNAKQKMEYQAWGKILETVFLVAFGFFVIFHFPSAENLSYVYLASVFFSLVFISLLFNFKVSPIRFSFDFLMWKKYLSLSWPLAFGGLIASLCANIDSAMMGYWSQITQIGFYNAAQRIVTTSVIPTNLIAISFFPILSQFFTQAKEKLQHIWNYYSRAVIFFALPIIVGGVFLGPKIIHFAYGGDFNPAILAFQILIVSGGMAMLSGPLNQILFIANQQKKTFFVTLLSAIINTSLNFILIPKYSLYGAAFTTLVASLVGFFLLFWLTSKLTPIKALNRELFLDVLISIFSSLLMYIIISQPKIYNLYVVLTILIGALVYSVAFLLLKKVLRCFIK